MQSSERNLFLLLASYFKPTKNEAISSQLYIDALLNKKKINK